MAVFSLKKIGLSTAAYPTPSDLFITTTWPAFHTRRTGIPAIMELGSSSAAELTVSLAPMTRARSVSGKSSLISSISKTTSYGTPASASKTFNCPGILPATGDSKSDILSLLFQEVHHLSNWVLTLGNSKTISRNDDDIFGIGNGRNGLIQVPNGSSSSDFHGFASASVSGSRSSKNDIGKRSVHDNTHNVGKNSSRGSNQ